MCTTRNFAVLALTLLALVSLVTGHGALTIPTPRNSAVGPVSRTSNSVICRTLTKSTPTVTMTSGQSFTVRWQMPAAHRGDCHFYLTYDTDKNVSTQQWFKIADFAKCREQNNQNLTIMVPPYLPQCDHCILRFEWVAFEGNIQWYPQCVDVKIAGLATNVGRLPTPVVTLVNGAHMPANSADFRSTGANDPCFLVGPALGPRPGYTYPTTGSVTCTAAANQGCTTCTNAVAWNSENPQSTLVSGSGDSADADAVDAGVAVGAIACVATVVGLVVFLHKKQHGQASGAKGQAYSTTASSNDTAMHVRRDSVRDYPAMGSAVTLEPEPEAALPEGWAQHFDEQGHPYYYNEHTGESSWEVPV